MLAEDAEAKYGDYRRWSSVLLPLTTLVFPFAAMGGFTLWFFSEDAFWQGKPLSRKGREQEEAYDTYYPGARDLMAGLVYPEDFQAGLEEAWEKAKPKGSTVTVEEKLATLSTQNNPHWNKNRPAA
eukprot:CAMPEP_0198499600 /NCGR_PEP_ID=MMETSP1462-20131121/7710_1 /TAXON_ID=1333877 /ORGANISM="Brandtodinium nutriculum, Strain RCC3387" /LENGTH=125 /DNA_ID=CAMNT_0044228583 /DNA_START=1 /DNA_END=378 /DNA_ORIENTATION=-